MTIQLSADLKELTEKFVEELKLHRKWDRKLQLAKEAYESGSYDKETLEYIFPELKKEEQ